MDWQIERNDVAVTGDFEAFVRATVLFEIWGPELDVERIQVELSRVRPGRPLHRCTVEVKLAGVGTFVGGTIGTDPLDTVKRAALAVAAIAPRAPASSSETTSRSTCNETSLFEKGPWTQLFEGSEACF